MTIKDLSQENFHKICVVGGGITGALMVLLLKKSNVFKLSDIGWINPNLKSKYDFRTTFYNETSLELLNNLNILKDDEFIQINKGKINLKGRTISSENIHVEPENRNIALSFQENSLFPHYNIEKNIKCKYIDY